MAEDLQQQQVELERIFMDIVKRSYIPTYAPRLHALSITDCNATGPFPFTKATIEYELPVLSHKSAVWFESGFVSIAKALLGDNSQFRVAKTFENILKQIADFKNVECLRSMLKSKIKCEADVQNVLAAHYFQPLVYGSECIVGIGGPNMCEYCKQPVDVGDTSLGNPLVWHGKADIVVKHSAIKVAVEPTKEDDDDDDGDDDLASGEPGTKQRKIQEPFFSSIVEVKLDSAIQEALAEGIVNAFCEARKDESLSKKFIPSFLATEKFIRIILYNRHSDILLLSDEYAIWDCLDDTGKEILNIDTLIHVWLALNFDNFDMEVSEDMLKNSVCSNFREKVKKKYSIYLTRVSKPCEQYQVAGPLKKYMSVEDVKDETYIFYQQIESQCYKKIKRIMEQK